MSGKVVIVDLRVSHRPKVSARLKGSWKREAKVLLMWAQGGVCAHCERPFPETFAPNAQDSPTIDHVLPRCIGGGNGLANLLLKHRSCNMESGSRPPSARDRKWQAVVQEKIAKLRPSVTVTMPARARA